MGASVTFGQLFSKSIILWLLTVFWTSPENVVAAVVPQQPTGLGSTSHTVHVRACVHFRKICDCVGRSVGQSTFFLVRRLSGGLGWSGGAVEWWSGGAVIQSVIPLLSWSWAVYSSVLCRESRVLQISVLRLLLRSGDMVSALAFVNVSPSKARRARAQPPSCNNSYASRPVATYKVQGSNAIEWGQGYCSGCHASVSCALPWVLSACERNKS